jgi:hypothetical protein
LLWVKLKYWCSAISQRHFDLEGELRVEKRCSQVSARPWVGFAVARTNYLEGVLIRMRRISENRLFTASRVYDAKLVFSGVHIQKVIVICMEFYVEKQSCTRLPALGLKFCCATAIERERHGGQEEGLSR